MKDSDGFGLAAERRIVESRVREINVAAARIAREAAGDKVYVAGAIGPLGLRIEPATPEKYREILEKTAGAGEGEGESLYFYDFDNNLFELHAGTLEQRLERYRR